MKSYNLQWYVDKIKRGEQFSLVRYGDGEMYCMWGKQGQNSNGCKYTPKLRTALLDSMNHKEENFIYGMQRVLPKDRERFEKEYPNIEFYDTEIFSEAVANGELYPLIEQLRKMELVFIGNSTIWDMIHRVFDCRKCTHIEVPKSNAFEMTDEVLNEVRKESYFNKNKVYLFSCGMAANVFISELHGRDGWFLDVGHIWDPFVGLMSRCDLEGKTMEDIEKNLHDR